MIFGTDPNAGLFLGIIKVDPRIVPRFRDCFYNGEYIIVHTRTGGGNREEYKAENQKLRESPLFDHDEDDDYDSTFANFYYRVPEELQELFAEKREEIKSPMPKEKWQAVLDKLKGGKDA
jgi:hypothetical protein